MSKNEVFHWLHAPLKIRRVADRESHYDSATWEMMVKANTGKSVIRPPGCSVYYLSKACDYAVESSERFDFPGDRDGKPTDPNRRWMITERLPSAEAAKAYCKLWREAEAIIYSVKDDIPADYAPIFANPITEVQNLINRIKVNHAEQRYLRTLQNAYGLLRKYREFRKELS